jgi:hypothetical protein
MCGILGLLALLVVAGMVIALPAEVGARLEHGHWLPFSLPILWAVLRAWLENLKGGAMVGWPAMDRARLPSARLYASLLVAELVFLPVLMVAVIWGLRVVGRFWTADQPGEGRQDALARARGRLGADGRAGTRGLRR